MPVSTDQPHHPGPAEMHPRPVLRFAPSPNGELHLGHAYSALFTWVTARHLGGTVLLRIEDIDLARTRERFVTGIYDDLAWLGLQWPEPVRRQSRHFSDYRAATERLTARGLIYRCYATRREIRAAVAGLPDHPRDPDGALLYPGRGRVLSQAEESRRATEGEPFALRLDMAGALARAAVDAPGPVTCRAFDTDGSESRHALDPARWGDVVIMRKDIPTSYHLSVVVDDALQGITHVTRGRDLEPATDLHRLLQILLALPEPAYRHHQLIADDTGRKLAKSARDPSLRALREAGVTPAEIRRTLNLPG